MPNCSESVAFKSRYLAQVTKPTRELADGSASCDRSIPSLSTTHEADQPSDPSHGVWLRQLTATHGVYRQM